MCGRQRNLLHTSDSVVHVRQELHHELTPVNPIQMTDLEAD